MTAAKQNHARIEVLETRMSGVESTIRDLIREVRADREERSKQPRPIALKEIAASVASTLAIVAVVATFSNSWVNLVAQADRERIVRIETDLKDMRERQMRQLDRNSDELRQFYRAALEHSRKSP